MDRDRLILLRRIVLALVGVAAAWASVVSLTGGFVVWLGPLRLSSRNPRNALLAATVCAIAVWVLSSPRRAGPLSHEWRWWQQQARAAVALLRVLMVRAWRGFRWLPLPIALAAIGVGLDIYQWAGPPPFWQDEEAIALNVRDRAFAELSGPLWLGQSAPLGWLMAQRLVVLTLGTSEPALRLIPLLSGVATVALALWIGRRWMSTAGTTGLVALCWAGAFISHYRFEMKPYTGDAFWALLLPALVAWAAEGADSRERMRRSAIWWALAAGGQFLANGALLVTPACAAVLAVLVWRRDGLRGAAIVLVWGMVWLIPFAVHYELSISHAHHSRYLRSFWASALPPDGADWLARLRWLGERAQPLADVPAGTRLWPSLWVLALGGYLCTDRRALGMAFATVPLSAFALAALGLVPLRDRLALWIVPSLYLGVALGFDRAVRYATDALRNGRWLRTAAASIPVALAVHLGAEVWQRGWTHREIQRMRDSKERMNDASGVRWLMAQYRPGDALVGTRLTWPAIWWYGGIPIGNLPGARSVEWASMFEVAHRPPGRSCQRTHLRDALADRRRALVYMSFPDEPTGFEDLLLRQLQDLGAIVAVNQFSRLSRAVIVEIGAEPTQAVVAIPPSAPAVRPALAGCVAMRPARRW